MHFLLFALILTGRVTDPAGQPVPGARVRLQTPAAEAASVLTGQDGVYAFPSLPPGVYLLRVEKQGFSPYAQPLRAFSGQRLELDIALTLTPVREEVTVSAEAGEILDGARTPQRVTLLSRSLLEEQATRTLAEAAAGQPGVAEQRTAPAMGSIFVRGLAGKNVSLYRDGIRYTTSAQRGGVSTFQNLVDPAVLEAIEVLRGPNSAQYGSDSLGGALNMVSRGAPLSPVPFFTAGAGLFFDSATRGAGLQTSPSWSSPRWTLASYLAARRINTARTGASLDSHSALTRFLGLPSSLLGPRLPDTAFTQYGGSLHAQFRLTDTAHLITHYERGQQDGAKRYDQLLGGDGNLIASLRNLMADFAYLRLQFLHPPLFDRAALSSSFNAQREERVNQGGNGNPAAAITHQYERMTVWGLQLQGERRLRAHSLSTGAEGYHESSLAPAFSFDPISSTVTLTRPRIPSGARYLNYGFYVQDAWEPERVRRLRLSGALRFGGASYRSRASASPLVRGRPLWPGDSLAANALSGRAGATFHLGGPLSLHFNYARAFRAPSITDLGTLGLQGNGAFEASYSSIASLHGQIGDRAGDQAVSTGRPVEPLRPESSDSLDYGLTLTSARLLFHFDSFWSRLGNTIVSQTLILPPGAVGLPLGDQFISRQLPSGAVFVPAATSPVLVRANYGGARMKGIEQSLRIRLAPAWTLNQTWTWIHAADSFTGLPPDIEPGIPAPSGRFSLLFAPPRLRLYFEAFLDAARRQTRLSPLALSDRRIGAARSRSNIASFFNNGARVRGLTAGGILLPTGETLAQVQQRVLGGASSAPLFDALPGYAVPGLRFGAPLGRQAELFLDLSNLTDRNYRGMGWGIDALGRSATLKLRFHL